jgi:hypothetical protein
MKSMYNISIAILLTGMLSFTAMALPGTPELAQLKVSRVYPVPASTSVYFEYALDKPAKVKVIIMDVTGRTVAVNETYKQAGVHTTQLEVEDLKSGIYFYTLDAENHSRAGGRFSKQ